MESKFYETCKVCMLGFIFIAILFPTGGFAQGKESMQYKLFSIGDLLKLANPDSTKTLRTEILTDKDNAKNIGGIFAIMPPGLPISPMHYHTARESIIMIQSGEGVEVVEGKLIPVKAGDIIFVPPMTKHSLRNTSDKDLKYMEFFSPIPFDAVEVK